MTTPTPSLVKINLYNCTLWTQIFFFITFFQLYLFLLHLISFWQKKKQQVVVTQTKFQFPRQNHPRRKEVALQNLFLILIFCWLLAPSHQFLIYQCRRDCKFGTENEVLRFNGKSLSIPLERFRRFQKENFWLNGKGPKKLPCCQVQEKLRFGLLSPDWSKICQCTSHVHAHLHEPGVRAFLIQQPIKTKALKKKEKRKKTLLCFAYLMSWSFNFTMASIKNLPSPLQLKNFLLHFTFL